MLVTKLARVYAKALIDLALEQKQLEEVKADLDWIQATLQEVRDLRVLLSSPVVKADRKKAILSEIFAERISALSLNFLHLLVSHGREESTLAICSAFEKAYLQHKGIQEVSVSTAVALSDAERAMVLAKAQSVTGGEVLLREHTDPQLIGGLVLRVGDQQYNGSLAYRLKQMRRELISDHYISKI